MTMRRACSAEQQQKYEALVRKQEEVHAFLDGFDSMQGGLRAGLEARAAEVRETLQKTATLQGVLAGATPDRAMLDEVKSALAHTSLQAENSAETSVRSPCSSSDTSAAKLTRYLLQTYKAHDS